MSQQALTEPFPPPSPETTKSLSSHPLCLPRGSDSLVPAKCLSLRCPANTKSLRRRNHTHRVFLQAKQARQVVHQIIQPLSF